LFTSEINPSTRSGTFLSWRIIRDRPHGGIEFRVRKKSVRKIREVHDMANAASEAVRARIQPHQAIAEFARILWHLRAILAMLLIFFLALSVAMYYAGGAVDVATRTQSSAGQTFYFCAVTALTIGYGDVVPTTALGRIVAVSLGLLGVLITGVVTASAVYAIQVAAHRAGLDLARARVGGEP
jgi:voltage-gated potassium channel